MKIQELLLKQYPGEIEITGIFDKTTDKLVRNFQSENKLNINGIVDFKTYNTMLGNIENNNETHTAVVINKNGAFVYQKPMINSNIVEISVNMQIQSNIYNYYFKFIFVFSIWFRLPSYNKKIYFNFKNFLQ